MGWDQCDQHPSFWVKELEKWSDLSFELQLVWAPNERKFHGVIPSKKAFKLFKICFNWLSKLSAKQLQLVRAPNERKFFRLKRYLNCSKSVRIDRPRNPIPWTKLNALSSCSYKDFAQEVRENDIRAQIYHEWLKLHEKNTHESWSSIINGQATRERDKERVVGLSAVSDSHELYLYRLYARFRSA